MLEHLQRLGLFQSDMRRAPCDRVRLRLLKIGAVVKISARNPVPRLSLPSHELVA
ncbi:MAG: hypothetical protein CSA62_12000 [Planctomycetota bacterium]|nr:MAG: hypothetical protein CSA62_12000 [Planctomycetota bacterium]